MRGPRFAAVLLFLLTPPAAAASKLDSRLQLLKRLSPPALGVQGTTGAPAPSLSFLVTLTPGATKAGLAARHPAVTFRSQLGLVVTALGPLSALDELEADVEVVAVEADRRAHPANDVIRSSSTSGGLLLGSLKNGLSDLGSADGTGVVIGIVDTGIDWTHADFVDAGTSRILALWDQNDAGGPNPTEVNASYTYGSEWLKTGVNGFDANLGNANCLAVGGASCPIRQLDSNGHGTNVAGIAGGNGTATGGVDSPNFYSGLAPKARYIIVNTDFKNASVLDGINYIVSKAAALAPGQPVVINLSLGENSGPHDGTDAFSSGVNSVAANTPVVVAMGNDQLGSPHADATIGSGGNTTFTVNDVGTPVDPFGGTKTKQTCLNTEFWHPSSDHYSVTVSVTCSGSCPSPISATTGSSNQTTTNGVTITIQNDQAGNGKGDNQVFVQVEDHGDINCNSTGGKIVTNYSVQFTNTAHGSTGRVDGYNDPELSGVQFTSNVDSNGTLTEPADGPNVISVAAYTSKKCWPATGGASPFCDNGVTPGHIAAFSGHGPTRDNTMKPDIAAPGEYIAAAKSKDYSPGYPNVITDLEHTIFHGTSQATPAVVGAVALRLQVAPTLTPAQVKAALRADGRSDGQTGGVGNGNYTWGYGKMLAPPLIQAAPTALTVAGVGVSTIGYSWALAANATSYSVYYSSSPNFFIASVTSPLQYTLPTQPNTQTAVRVCGVNATGLGACATSASTVTLPSPIPNQPAYQVSVSSILVTYSACPATTCSGYIFQAATNANFTGTVFSTATDNPALLKLQFPPGTLTAATPYFLRVGSLNSVSASSMTALGSTTTLTNILVPGAGLQGPIAATSIQFNWTSGGNSGGTTYVAKVSTVANFGSGAIFTQSGVDLFSANFTGLSVNTSYYFAVNALLGPTLSSGPVSTLALAPVSSPPNFANAAINAIRVQWSAGTDPPGTEYLAQLSASPSFSPLVGSSLTLNAFADFAGLNPNTTYYAQAAAVGNGGGATAFTNLGAASTLAQPLSPAAVPFTNAFATGFTANFLNPSNPPGTLFVAQISTSADFTTVAASSQTYNTFAVFSALTPNQTYYMAAAALNNNSVLSSTAAFFNPAAISTVALPAAPAAVSPAGSTQTAVGLFANWGAGANARPTVFLAEAADNAQFAGAASSATYNLFAGFGGLQTNTSYFLRARALDNDSSGLASAATPLGFASTLPNPPGVPGQPFVSVTFASVTVNWNALPAAPPVATCEGYRVQASLDPGFGTIAASADFPFGATTGGVAGLASSKTYFVRVGAVGFDGSANFALLGSTATPAAIVASAVVDANGATVIVSPGGGSALQTVQVTAPPGVLPLGSVLTVSPSVATLPPPTSNEAKLSIIGSGVAFDISAGGHQPAGLVRVVVSYAPSALASGVDPRTIQLARYDTVAGQWTLQQSAVDAGNHLIIAEVGHFTLFSPFAVTAASDLSDVNIFPIPWEPTSNNTLFNGPFLTIANLPENARVRIFTISGERVWEGHAGANGVLTWPGNNSFGRIVGSGTYLVVIDGGGKRITRRAVIVR